MKIEIITYNTAFYSKLSAFSSKLTAIYSKLRKFHTEMTAGRSFIGGR